MILVCVIRTVWCLYMCRTSMPSSTMPLVTTSLVETPVWWLMSWEVPLVTWIGRKVVARVDLRISFRYYNYSIQYKIFRAWSLNSVIQQHSMFQLAAKLLYSTNCLVASFSIVHYSNCTYNYLTLPPSVPWFSVQDASGWRRVFCQEKYGCKEEQIQRQVSMYGIQMQMQLQVAIPMCKN